MALGEFHTINTWQMRAGSQGHRLEDLTKMGIIPQYGQVPGVKAVKLFKVVEGDDSGQYMAITIWESRQAYLNWWNNSASPKFVEWQDKYKDVLDNWLDMSYRTHSNSAELILEQDFPPGTPKIKL
jgi:heme-degrading monooxygenase HmoA